MRCAAALFVVSLVAAPSVAAAQVHWDASAHAGVMKRFLTSKPTGGGDAGFGPSIELDGHVALFPLFRVGAYVAHDAAPMPGDVPALQITSFGARARLTSPWPLDPWRLWLFAGFGYAAAYGPSYTARVLLPGGAAPADASVGGAGGGFFEVPLGLGVSYKLRRPWHLMAELGGRGGFAFRGSVFDSNGRSSAGPTGQAGVPFYPARPGGVPSFGVSLLLGVMVDL